MPRVQVLAVRVLGEPTAHDWLSGRLGWAWVPAGKLLAPGQQKLLVVPGTQDALVRPA